MITLRRIPLTWPLVARTGSLPDGRPLRTSSGWLKRPGTRWFRLGAWLYLIGRRP